MVVHPKEGRVFAHPMVTPGQASARSVCYTSGVAACGFARRDIMNPIYSIQDTSSIFSPALVFYKDLIRRNIAKVIEMAGSVERLRPHAKTHKTREIARMELD